MKAASWGCSSSATQGFQHCCSTKGVPKLLSRGSLLSPNCTKTTALGVRRWTLICEVIWLNNRWPIVALFSILINPLIHFIVCKLSAQLRMTNAQLQGDLSSQPRSKKLDLKPANLPKPFTPWSCGLEKNFSGVGHTSLYQPWSLHHHLCSHLLNPFLALNACHQELLHSYHFCDVKL